MFVISINELDLRFMEISIFICIYKESSIYLADERHKSIIRKYVIL